MSDRPPINKITWRCPRCGAHLTTALGCKWIIFKGLKRRICPACVQDREGNAATKASSSVVTESNSDSPELLACTTRHDLPPIPKGLPAPNRLKYHG
jgi:hypothetical protein